MKPFLGPCPSRAAAMVLQGNKWIINERLQSQAAPARFLCAGNWAERRWPRCAVPVEEVSSLAVERLEALKTVWPHGRDLVLGCPVGQWQCWDETVALSMLIEPQPYILASWNIVIQQHMMLNTSRASDIVLALGIQGRQGRPRSTYGLVGRQTYVCDGNEVTECFHGASRAHSGYQI